MALRLLTPEQLIAYSCLLAQACTLLCAHVEHLHDSALARSAMGCHEIRSNLGINGRTRYLALGFQCQCGKHITACCAVLLRVAPFATYAACPCAPNGCQCRQHMVIQSAFAGGFLLRLPSFKAAHPRTFLYGSLCTPYTRAFP